MKKLVGFDVDGTLVPNIPYSWEEFHRVFSIDRIKLDRLMNDYQTGKISFEDWGAEDTKLWQEKNLHKSDFIRVIEKNFHLANGAVELFEELQSRNHVLAIISGSLSIVMEVLIPDFKKYFSHLHIGHLIFDEKECVNRYESGKILQNGRENKFIELEEICCRENVPVSQSVFVGDNVNDISALHGAGLGIAFRPRSERVIEAADVVIHENNLLKILDYF